MIPIECICVWDTVGALGIPIDGSLGNWLNRKYAFHNVKLGERVKHAYHAMAIDEQRKPFKAALWDQVSTKKQKVEQVWFAGYHANVGGGLRPDGLANIPLKWMIGRAQDCGLEFDEEYVEAYEGEIRLPTRNSMTLFWRIFGRWLRPIGESIEGFESVDGSVYERIKIRPKLLGERNPYGPRNLTAFEERQAKLKQGAPES